MLHYIRNLHSVYEQAGLSSYSITWLIYNDACVYTEIGTTTRQMDQNSSIECLKCKLAAIVCISHTY